MKFPFLIICLIIYSFNCFGNDNIIMERINNFKNTEKSLKKITKFAKINKFDKVIIEAQLIQKWFVKISSFFPKGTQASMSNNSDASSDIWSNFDKFLKLAMNTQVYSQNIIKAAKEENISSLSIAISETSKSCTQCHRLFRN